MAASTVENNTDLLSQILINLPVKSLMRFKCVSKRWLSHISNPCFTRSHTLHHYTPFPSHLLHTKILTDHSCFLTMPPSTENTVPSNPFITDFQFLNVLPHEHLFIEKSCNGLLLIKGSSPNCYYVCNPLTKQFLAFDLPSSPQYPSPYSQLIYLAFDPMRSPHYKLIVILYCELSPYENPYDICYSFEIRVYSSKTRSWTDFGISFPYDGSGFLIGSNGVYCNGVIYWYIDDLESLCFDVENQCFKRFPLPKDGDFVYDNVFYFGESAGHLHMILHHPDDNFWLLIIFELKEDSSGWSLRFHVNLGQLFPRFPHILCVFRQEKEEDSVLMFQTGDQIILYNLLDRTFRRLIDFDNSLSPIVQVLQYTREVLQYSQNHLWDGDSSAF